MSDTRERGKCLTKANECAIVGMACLFPGADSLSSYWQVVCDQRNCIGEPPADWVGRYALDENANESDRLYNIHGGYLGDLAQFDPLQFGIQPNSIDGAEPEHFLALRVAAEAIQDAGALNRDSMDVILGRGTFVNRGLVTLHQHGLFIQQFLGLLKQLHPEYRDEQLIQLRHVLRQKIPPLNAQTSPGMVSSVMSGRIANRLDLRGKNSCLDAACASSLIAVEHAIRDLALGKCDAVLVGGVHVSLNPLVMMMFTQLGALARDTRVRTFSKSAAGTLLGEGVGMVVIKRLADAQRDGNRVYCLIKSVGSASDGKARSVVAPSVAGEELALRRAYAAADIDPYTVGLVEAHGTGMPRGDRVELEALGNLLSHGRGPCCAVGSVKSNIGHLLPAAGIAGLIKTALALYQRVLPPIAACEDPVDQLVSDDAPFYVNTATRPWIHGDPHPRRAGVSAFGFGGINSHAILEEYRHNDITNRPSFHQQWDSEVCVFSGSDHDELVSQLELVHGYLSQVSDVCLKDVAYTLAKRVADWPQRLAIVAETVDDLIHKIRRAQQKLGQGRKRIKDRKGIFLFDAPLAREGQLAFLFPGEGAQYENMLSDICLHFPVARRCFDEVEQAFAEKSIEPSLKRVLFPPPHLSSGSRRSSESSALWRMDYGVQSVTTANRALCRILEQLRIIPAAVLGHSSGEFAALEMSKAFSFADTAALVRYIQDGMRTVERVAAATAALPEVRLIAASAPDRQELQALLDEFGDRVVVAMDNCPFQIVVCGAPADSQQFVARLHERGISCTELPFQRGYHTAWFADACGPLAEFYARLAFDTPKVPLYSCATATRYPKHADAVRSLAMEQWCSPVRFRETIEVMHRDGVRLFLEVGPRGNLSSFVTDALGDKAFEAIRTNVQHRSGIRQLNEALGLLVAHHVPVDLEFLFANRHPLEIDWTMTQLTPERGGQRKISMALPFIELDQEDLERLGRGKNISASERARSGALSSGRTPPPAAGNGMESLTAKTRITSLSHSTAPNASESPRPASTRLPSAKPATDPAADREEPLPLARGRAGDSAADLAAPQLELSLGGQMIDAYFRTMEQFAEVQKSALHTVRRRRQERGAVEARATISVGDTRSPPLLNDVRLPFVGKVIRETPGEEILLHRLLDVNEDLYLSDHVLGGRVSMYNRGLTALPVNPLTMSIEMLAQVALRMMPGMSVTAVRNIKAHRWMVIDDSALLLVMHGQRIDDDLFHVTIRESGETHKLPIIEADIKLAPAYPTPPPAEDFPLKNAKPSRFSADRMYKEAMFNGPRFQAIESIALWAEDGLIARLQPLAKDRLFRSTANPHLVTAPVILDGAGQTIAHWNGEHDPSGFRLFPYLVEELRIHAPGHLPPDALELRLRLQELRDARGGVTGFKADLHLVDDAGRLWMELLGWHVKLFDLPETFYGMLHDSIESQLGDAWQAPLALAVGDRSDAYELRRVSRFSRELLLSHGRIWLKALARQVFSVEELERWRSGRMSEDRRIQYLLGRVAAKDAVRALINRVYGLRLCPGDIEIDSDGTGRPVVIPGEWSKDSTIGLPRISISHTGLVAVALATLDEGVLPGVDIEAEREWDPTTIDALFSVREQSLVNELDPSRPERWYTRLWCAKEAVAKATGIGIGADPRSYPVKSVDPTSGRVEIVLSGTAAVLRPDIRDALFEAFTFAEMPLILGMCIF